MSVRVPTTTLDQETADRLSAGFHRCLSDFEADDGLLGPDTFFDLLPPMWRFQLEGPGERPSPPTPMFRNKEALR